MPSYTNTVTSTHQDFTWTGGPSSFSSISLIPGIEYNAQLEVERQFALDRSGNPTIAAFLGSEFVSTQDKRQVFVIPNQYITYNTTNKTITGFTLSNYNYTYYLTTDLTQTTPLNILVPNISTSVNTLFTVKRKSISNQALVTWADGGKLTSSQLNLQTQQLLFLAQETADRINTELSNATDIAYAIADGAITYTKILGDGVNAWNFASPIITISPTSNLHATTRLYTLNSIYNHGVITKDDTAPSSSAVDILETAATAGNSGIWFDPKLGQLQVWAGNAWVALVGVPLSTNNIVDIGSTQTITGAKTFSSTLGVTGATTIQGLTVGKGGGSLTTNTVVGVSALALNSTGTANNAFGHEALNTNTTGSYNNAFGYAALQVNTTGVSNSAFGHGTLASNTTGYSNTAVGEGSLYSNISGYQNTAVGMNALILNTTGIQNTAVGLNALYSNITGFSNNAFGLEALKANKANNNNAFGYKALTANTTGTLNCAFGHQALFYNTTGSNNNAVGYAALASNTIGVQNNAFGHNALASNTTGNYSSAFGQHALYVSTGSNNNAFGAGALGSNTTGTQNSAFGNSALLSNTTGIYNTAFGQSALQQNQTGYQNTAVGLNSLFWSAGNNNTAIGFSSGSGLTTGAHNTYIGYNAQGSTATIGNEVSIYNNSITARFQGAASGWTFVSDARDKNNVKNLNFGLDFVTQLQPRKFNWNIRNSNVDNGKEASGFIAQELLSVVESQNASCLRLVDTNDPNQFSITQTNLIPVLVKAIQELKAELEATKLRITQLENIP